MDCVIDEYKQCYRLGTIPNLRVIFSAHVVFHENEFPLSGQAPRHTAPIPQRSDYRLLPHAQNDGDAPSLQQQTSTSEQELKISAPRQSSRTWNPTAKELNRQAHFFSSEIHSNLTDEAEFSPNFTPTDFHDADGVFATAGGDPPNRRAAMSSPDAINWRRAELEEISSHIENNTFSEPVDLPHDRKAITCKWGGHRRHPHLMQRRRKGLLKLPQH